MKKYSITILFLLLGWVVKAQEDITLFRFLSKNKENGKTYALTTNLKDNTLVAKEITDQDFNFKTGYLDGFIVMPHPIFKSGQVLIVSAKDKTKFLKLNPQTFKLEIGNYFTHANKNNLDENSYGWYLNFAGSNEEVHLQPPFLYTNALTLENGSFKIKNMEDTKGNPADFGGSLSDGERISDKQIFVIQKLTNSL